MGLAGSVFLAGETNRLAFGVIDQHAGFVYGKTALYVARTPEAPRRKGPYVAPADVLVTDPPYRSSRRRPRRTRSPPSTRRRSRSASRASTR